MAKNRKRYIIVLCIIMAGIVALRLSLLTRPADKGTSLADVLTDSISQIVSACPGEVGVALIINGTDTVTVNDRSVYPMMSVFKVHQALAVCDRLDKDGISLDTLLTITREELDPNTWSPMLKEHPEAPLSLPVRDLLRYALIQSDNNASNVMFRRLAGAVETDSLIATIIPHHSFRIAYTEAEMAADHARAYSNYTSPLGAAMLMDRLFADTLISPGKQHFIMLALSQCATGKDRIAAPLLGKAGVSIAHKTGSGYSTGGILIAHNDVAHITLPNGLRYTLAIFVKEFRGNEAQASEVMAHISATVYSLLAQGDTGRQTDTTH